MRARLTLLPLPASLLATFMMGIATTTHAAFASTEVFLPAVGRAAGNGAQIYTTVWATNLTQAPETFTFHFLKQGQSNAAASSPITRSQDSPDADLASTSFTDALAPGETKVYENIVEAKLGLSGVIGAARIVSSGEIFVSERIFNQNTGDDLGKTEGMFFTGVPKAFSISQGQSASVQAVNQGGNENFRTNFVLVETGGGSPTVNVQVFDASGLLQGQKAYPLQPYEQVLPNITDVVSGIATTNSRITATVTGGTGSVILSLAQIANESQDPSGAEMTFRDSLLGSVGTAGVTSLNGLQGVLTIAHGANTTVNVNGQTITIDAVSGSGTGLTAVAHDNSLAGSGTVSVPLGIAPGQVVRSVNGLHDTVTLAAGSNVTITPNGQTLTITATGGGGGGVSSLNALSGALAITPGNGISITPSGSSIQVAYTGGGSSGLTSVTHDATLAGAGTGANPLGIANGGVGLAQLSASGSSSGQVLTSTGSAVAWQTPSGGGLTLPYEAIISANAQPAFSITNNGTNASAIVGQSNSSVGVYGHSMGLWGVWGESSSNDGVYGITGATDSSVAAIHGVTYTQATGVLGESFGDNGTGVKGNATGTGSIGVHGTGDDLGVRGDTTSGNGVAGYSQGYYEAGVLGSNTSNPHGFGVTGISGSFVGVKGDGGSGWGVFAVGAEGIHATTTAQGGYSGNFETNVLVGADLHVTGQIYAGTKDFEIDDPTDPENGFLIHASVESSDLKNIYDGVATLNESGLTVVELPDWFEALNGNFRYQLTAIGTPQPALYVAKKIEGNRFTIAGGVPGAEVSWMVTGIRHDAFAKAHPLTVRKPKTAQERGFYLHPQAFGQPEEKGIEWGRRPEHTREAKKLREQSRAMRAANRE